MEVEFVTDETSEDEAFMTENYGLDDNVEDYLNFEGERCGICMDVVVDRGVLDCCQHWFCFACIDNWATITSLCPLCQNEFQLITCVPVHDTVGGDKTDEESYPSDDDWFVEGTDKTLSFPSYYIDETAVVCLAEDGCKVRSGSVAIDEDSDIDTSIACDSCDKWFHAYCVGFDPESTSDSSWLCPRCTSDKCLPQKADRISAFMENYHSGLEVASCDRFAEDLFPKKALVSITDEGETAVVISQVDGCPESRESIELVVQSSKDSESTLLHSPNTITLNSEAREVDGNGFGSSSCKKDTELCQSLNKCDYSLNNWPPVQLDIIAENAVNKATGESNNVACALDLDFGSHIDIDRTVEKKGDDTADDPIPKSGEPDSTSKDLLLDANMVPSEMELLSQESKALHAKEIVSWTSGAKRKLRNSRHANDGDREAKFSRKETEDETNSQSLSLTDEPVAFVPDDSSEISCDEKEYGSSDIRDIVKGGEGRSLKQLQQKKISNRIPKEREGSSGFRLKKIMRTAGNDEQSSVLVQELRKKIREAVGNKSTEEIGQSLFEPKLLEAFRAALAGSGAENRKPTLDVKAKKSLLQKGKVRESLTKKIYGDGGKRKRAWTREHEVEFWKHRCAQAGRPEKVETLKSVLDLLRDDSISTNKMPRKQEEAKASSILSRLYLADTSVCPRKDDIKPVSALEAVATTEQKRESSSSGKLSLSLPAGQSDKKPQQHNSSPALGVQSLPDGKEIKRSVKGTKAEISSGDAHGKRDRMKAPVGMKTPTEKDKVIKSDLMRGDKRKWALEVLARKTVALSNSAEEMEKDNAILKGYSLLGQLPKDMRPVLAPSRHNKIPIPVRQAQLYRLTEHFLKKTKLPVTYRTAETELAVADAINIEKQVADKSKSKLVYLNLCSQELLRISDDVNSERAEETNPCSTSESLSQEGAKEADNCSSDLEVDEALKKAGLISDSPPNSPNHHTDGITIGVDSLGKIDDEGPENILEVDSHPEVDIYGDFEYNLEEDDFIGASSLTIFKQQAELPKIQVLFSSLKPEEQSGILDLPDHDLQDTEVVAGSSGLTESKHSEALAGSSGPTESEHAEALTGSSGPTESEHAEAVAGSSGPTESEHAKALACYSGPTESENAEALASSSGPTESENAEALASSSGPTESEHAEGLARSSESDHKPTEDVSRLDVSKEDAIQNSSFDNNVELSHTECEELYGPDKEPLVGKYPDTISATPFEPTANKELHVENGDCRPNNSGNEIKEKNAKRDKEQSKDVMKKVEAYIKEHIRPLCKSGVITVEQYRWAVGKTTEKVMKYHSKEKNANFLIKEGEKVKKLAAQYVEAATTQVESLKG